MNLYFWITHSGCQEIGNIFSAAGCNVSAYPVIMQLEGCTLQHWVHQIPRKPTCKKGWGGMPTLSIGLFISS